MRNFALLAAPLLLCLAASCSPRPSTELRDQTAHSLPAVTSLGTVAASIDAVSDAVRGQTVPDRMAQLLRPKSQPPVHAVLPDLNTLPLPRTFSAVSTFWVNGSAAQSQAQGTPQGTSLQLVSTAAKPAWAVYALTGTQAAYQLQHLQLETSSGSYSGNLPGYWVAVANYGANRWRVIDRSTAAAYSFSLAGNDNYLNAANTVYAAVLIAEGQSVTINRIGLERDDSLWQSLQLAGSGSGVTPAIDFGTNNNPSVVWANSDGTVSFAICDRSLGFGNLASWVASTAEGGPATASVVQTGDPESPNARAQWLDLVVDPAVGLPRISMLYTGLLGSRGNARFGLTALGDSGTALNWWNWRMAFTPDASYTSLARDPATGNYGAVWTADTRSLGASGQLNDMALRIIQWTQPDGAQKGQIVTSGSLFFGFGTNWLYPHIRYRSTGNPTVAVRGGYVYYQSTAGDPGTWGLILGEGQSLTFGSLAYGLDDMPSSAYTYTGTANQHVMRVSDFINLGTSNPLTADSQAVGASDALGETNQIAYLPDGNACLAYSQRNAAGVVVKYAQQNGNSWIVESVSPQLSTPASANDLIFLDLAVDSNGIPAICWQQRTGSSSALMVALRGN